MADEQGDRPQSARWDHVTRQVQEWRRRAGEPSYSEIALRISRERELRGVDPVAARVGRTTVYDAFRLGRSRINHDLVREIGRALGAEESEVGRLLEDPPREPTRPSPPVEIAGPAEPLRYGVRRSVLLMLGCLAMNYLGREVVDVTGLPVYLDMVGTALAAIVLGPWRGAAVGAATNLLLYFVTGPESVPFLVVNVVGALVWGYGVHRFGFGRTLARFFSLTIMVAVACSLTAVPIIYFLFDGSVGHGQDTLTDNMLGLTSSFAAALLGANMITSVADKMISAFVALVGASMLGHSVAGVTANVGSPRSLSRRGRRGARTP